MTPEEKNDREGATPPGGHELDAFLGKAFQDKSVWSGLWESVRDVFFPVKLPPLELTSKPIPIPDKMKVKANPWAIGISTTINVIILLIVLFVIGKKVIEAARPQLVAANIDVGDYNSPKDVKKAGGGGGGGDRSPIEANKGKLPKIEKIPSRLRSRRPSSTPSCLSRQPSMSRKTFACPTIRICQ